MKSIGTISAGLARAALAAFVDDRMVDLSYPLTADARVRVVTPTSPEALSEDRIIRIIREAGRVPAPCDCNYHILRRMEGPTSVGAPAAAAQTVH